MELPGTPSRGFGGVKQLHRLAGLWKTYGSACRRRRTSTKKMETKMTERKVVHEIKFQRSTTVILAALVFGVILNAIGLAAIGLSFLADLARTFD